MRWSPSTRSTRLTWFVGALLALSDGKLADMQALAEADGGVQQLNDAIGAAKALAAEL